MSLRLYLDPADAALAAGAELDLPDGAARHAQVRRVQPGDALRLFDGGGVDWPAQVLAMSRRGVRVRLGAAPRRVDGELPCAVTLALAVPANDRMDALVEKATELGAARVQPLDSARSVLRLDGARAERRRAHWQAVAVAAAEQCGRARVPAVMPPQPLAAWLRGAAAAATADGARWVLSLASGACTPQAALAAGAPSGASPGTPGEPAEPGVPGPSGAARPGRAELPQPPDSARVTGEPAPPRQRDRIAAPALPRTLWLVSGPEGGFTTAEDEALRAAGFRAVGLGPRVLRADTAPLAVLAWLGVQALVSAPDPHRAA